MAKPSNSRAIQATLKLYATIILHGWKLTLPCMLFVGVGTILVFYAPPLVIAELIKQPEATLATAWPYVAVFTGLWLLGEVMWRVALYFMVKFEASTIRYLYSNALHSLMQKELGFFSNNFSGSITKNVIAYARRFEAFFDTLIFSVVAELIPALFALVILAFISPWLSIALLIMMVFGVIVVRPLIKKRVVMVKVREEASAKVAGHISDITTNILAVKSFGSENSEQHNYESYLDDFVTKAKRSWHYQNYPIDTIIAPIYVATNVIGLAIVLSLDVDAAAKANLFIGYNYFANVTRFLWSFNSVYRRLEESITEASLFVEYTLTPPKIVDAPKAKDLSVAHGEIAFKNVVFRHQDSADTLFDSFNLLVKPGERVGLVGQSGAGKSSLVSTLLRFNEIESGAITIDGQSIAGITQQSLHTSISYVPQEPLLFHRSLRENIAYGRTEASDEQIITAAKQAHAHEFITHLKDGYDTLVGERGVKLSGGQRQRIAIARAILKDAPILVLDEATSALDSESEKLIQASLETLMSDRTSIVIAHRLSTIAKLDRIIVLDDGKIVEDGSHSQLLAKNGIYAKLWKHQSGGFIDDDDS